MNSAFHCVGVFFLSVKIFQIHIVRIFFFKSSRMILLVVSPRSCVLRVSSH
jgi:hypothetical protein